MEIYYFAFLALGAFVTALVGTRGAIVAQRQRPLFRVPRRDAPPAPRGGIALVLTLMIFLALATQHYVLIFSLLLLAGLALLDEWIRLSPLTLLLAQVVAALPLLPDVARPLFSHAHGPGAALLAAAWVGFVSLFRRMDAVEGVATASALAVAMGLLIIAALTDAFGGPESLAALVTLAACAGFLWWNWPPAKVALGEAGVIPLGFLLGWLLLRAAGSSHVAAALILPAYFFCDIIASLAPHALRRKSTPDAPFYRQSVRQGRAPDLVLRHVIGIHLLLILLATLASLEPGLAWMYLAIAYGMVAGVILFFFKHESPPH